PAWLRDAVALFRTEGLGCHFTSVLAALVRVETAFGFDEQTYGVVPADHQPKAIATWIQGGRTTKTTKIPAIKNVQQYAEEWSRWWDFLQPPWRRRGRDGNLVTGGDATYGGDNEWGSLDKPGPNGCLSLVAGLYFWGVCKDQPDDMKQRWILAVQDVAWM
ncbi:hypothetical protein B0H13DRAFT_1446437, partial [Mycena leptocephala]